LAAPYRRTRQLTPAGGQVCQFHGQAENLFVSLGRQQWGEFEPVRLWVRKYDIYRPGDDLLYGTSLITFLDSGTVYAVKQDPVPRQSLAAAAFRYGQPWRGSAKTPQEQKVQEDRMGIV
jgi:hypothetical protein